MPGLLSKIWMEVRWAVLWFSLGLAAVMALLTALLPRVLGDIHHTFERLPMVRPLITALLGVDPGDRISAELSQAFLWVHPTVLTLIWAHETMYCTRTPAGEIDRGTADFLFCLPVSRWSLYLSETIGWIVSGSVMLLVGFTGHWISSVVFPSDMRLSLSSALMVLSNLSDVYLAVGGFAFLVSSISDRRGRAMGLVFAVLLASFLLNFLAQFTDWARAAAPYLSVMEYYRPAIIIQSGEFPVRDVLSLTGLAAVLWTTGGVVFHRRSICTV